LFPTRTFQGHFNKQADDKNAQHGKGNTAYGAYQETLPGIFLPDLQVAQILKEPLVNKSEDH
jgi:hypothetical protein